MKLREVKLRNFRGYKDEISISFEELTILIGRNDAGKSSVLDALDIFFNDAEIEKEDACVHGKADDVQISCVFSDVPDGIVLDDQHPTTFQAEHLLRDDELLEICRVYNCAAAKGKQTRIFARAHHPSTKGCHDLIGLKLKELKARAVECGADLSQSNQTIKTDLRQAIWRQAPDLVFAKSEIDLSTETGKTVWEQIKLHLPVYALFKSDRASTDQDEEAQDPMKMAIRETVKKHEDELNDLIEKVKVELRGVADRTVEKIQEMSPDLAKTLDPQVKTKSWESLFSVSLTGDEGISMNKRGSGTRRLVLLNFFRAKAEDAADDRGTGAIYAVEEPETSQHPNHQIMLLDAFQELTQQGYAQVILTTHTPTLARRVDSKLLRLITVENGHPRILQGSAESTLELIKTTLGVLPNHDVKVFVGVEGKWDIEFLKSISKILNAADPTIPDLGAEEASGKLLFIPLGGSSMELWGARLARLDIPELYITDRDSQPPENPKYHKHIEEWNQRPNCTALCTRKRELENYLHPNAIRSIATTFPVTIADFSDVPLMLAETLHTASPESVAWSAVSEKNRDKKMSKAKRRLNTECVKNMTVDLLALSDPANEIKGWLNRIQSLIG